MTTVIHNLRNGARFLFEQPILRSLLTLRVPMLLSIGLWNSLLLPFAERALDASEFEFGIQEAMTSVGFVLGSFLMARISERLREGQWFSIGVIGFSIITIAYSRVVSIPFAISLVFVSGFLNAPAMIATRLITQRNTLRENRGRVTSVFLVSGNVMLLVGMAVAGLADVVDIRIMVLGAAILMLASGLLSLFMPGLGQPTSEWKRAIQLLRSAPSEPALGVGQVATLSDLELLISHLPLFSRLSPEDRGAFIEGAQVSQVDQGETIVREGEEADEVFFVLDGKAIAGVAPERGEYRSLSSMGPGDFFGEIAALTGIPRTANVVAEQDIRLLEVPAENVQKLMSYPRFRYLFLSKLTERLSRTHVTDFPRLARLDQDVLLELRTAPVKREIE